MLSPPWRVINVKHIIADERLGHRSNPKFPGHDSKGFRNEFVRKKAKIVTFGDSQTYGSNVNAKDAWPRQLETFLKKSVYSMAYGGYGPGHSLILWEEAASLNPDIYIEAFYSGNDLFDSFDLVYNRKQLSELKVTNKNIEIIVNNAELKEPITKRVSQIVSMGRGRGEAVVLKLRKFC